MGRTTDDDFLPELDSPATPGVVEVLGREDEGEEVKDWWEEERREEEEEEDKERLEEDNEEEEEGSARAQHLPFGLPPRALTAKPLLLRLAWREELTWRMLMTK